MAKRTVLIVEDEPHIAEALQYSLAKEGFRVLIARDGAEGLARARRDTPDAVLLDWMLPELQGLEVCRLLKQDEKTRRIPILMLTVKSEETDKVLGLEMGADDYVTKPFSTRELLARVKALLRRSALPETPEVFQLDALRVDWGRHLVSIKGKPVELTAKEFELLKALVEARGRVLSRETLLDRVWGYERAVEIETRTVDLHVSQLRKKLGPVAERIVTVKSAGYRLDQDG
jgi:two-component system alkaline phosphatase synthesis response regulator PhoP